MALGDVPASILQGYFTQAEFDANPGVILGAGQFLHLAGTDLFKRGDGVTVLSALPWRGIRRATSAAFVASNPELSASEIGHEIDTGQIKFGPGFWNDLTYVGGGSELTTRLISGGAISLIGLVPTVATATYSIEGSGTFTSPETEFGAISLSSAGNVRYVGFFGKSDGTVIMVDGTEGSSATYPDSPGNCPIGFVIVTDAGVGAPEPPQTVNFPDIGGNASENASLKAFVKNPRVYTVVSSANISLDVSLYDILYISALATNATITITGTPSPFRPIIVVIKDNGTARTVTYSSSNFFAAGESLRTTTTINKLCTDAFLYYPSNSKLGCVGSKTEA